MTSGEARRWPRMKHARFGQPATASGPSAPSGRGGVGYDEAVAYAIAASAGSGRSLAVEVPWYRMVEEVALYDRLEPLTRSRDRLVPAPAEVLLDLLQLRPQALGDRPALHGKVPLPVLPADMREAQKVERFRLPFSLSFPVRSAYRPNSIRRVLSGCSSSPNLPSRSRRSSRKRSASVCSWDPGPCHQHNARRPRLLGRVSPATPAPRGRRRNADRCWPAGAKSPPLAAYPSPPPTIRLPPSPRRSAISG